MANESNIVFLIGEKIRKYRTYRNLTQKKLAELCHISESAIRNYELGNRYPDDDIIMSISDALEIDRAALIDPDPSDVFSAEHIFMDFEQLYGIVPKMIDGELHFVFENPDDSLPNKEIINRYIMKELLLHWCSFREALSNGVITQEQYFEWCSGHSDVACEKLPVDPYKLTLDEQIRMETARRAEGHMPLPVWDENHVNVMPIPKKKKNTEEPTLEDTRLDEIVKAKRKRKPKNNA